VAGVLAAASVNASERAAVVVVRDAPWSPADTAREGAGEFSVLMNLAKVRREHSLAGLVGVGSAHGVFQTGAERALRFAVLSGVPVVKVAVSGEVASCPDGLFVEAGALSEAEACRLLAVALERCGPAPRAQNPGRPSDTELAAIRAHVERLQGQFILARGAQVARN
jgi:hypothetical protein